ncbi:MAG: M48 family metalloprotease [Candidatus Cloacimonetes bacterium]|nr:M48 family metalloprotease [Candidatus Cloacimonadota bacterium]
MQHPSKGTIDCPDCNRPLITNEGFTSWCECGWNIKKIRPNFELSLEDELIYHSFKNQSETLMNEILSSQSIHKKIQSKHFLLYSFSFLVMALNISLITFSFYLLVFHYTNVLAILLSIVLLFICWQGRIRFQQIDSPFLPRDEFSNTIQLINDIAKQLNVAKPDYYLYDLDFNAAVMRCGTFNSKRAIIVGLPLFYVLNPQEKVALISHELAHFSNNDPKRSIIIGSVYHSLITWLDILQPECLWPSHQPAIEAFFEFLGNICLYLISRIPSSLLVIFHLLNQQDSQRSEYYADLLGATISGKEAFNTMLQNFEYDHIVELCTQRITVQKDLSINFLNLLTTMISEVPAREKKRLITVSERFGLAIDESHPPTFFRQKVVDKLAPSQGQYTLSSETHSKIQREIEAMKDRIHFLKIDEYKEQLMLQSSW